MLSKLFKRNLKKNQETEQKVETQQQTRKGFQIGRYNLPFTIDEIEYISIFSQDIDDYPIYYIGVSNKRTIKILTETHTRNKDKILVDFEELKSYFKQFGCYANLGEGLPIINLHQTENVELVWDERDNTRDHCLVTLSNGVSYQTKSEIITTNINYNEWMAYTFASYKNDNLHGK